MAAACGVHRPLSSAVLITHAHELVAEREIPRWVGPNVIQDVLQDVEVWDVSRQHLPEAN